VVLQKAMKVWRNVSAYGRFRYLIFLKKVEEISRFFCLAI